MFINEVEEETIKKYLRLDDEDIDLLSMFWQGAINYIKSYTGMTDEEVNTHEDLTPIALLYVACFYDNRTLDTSMKGGTVKNSLIDTALNLYRKNLIPNIDNGDNN